MPPNLARILHALLFQIVLWKTAVLIWTKTALSWYRGRIYLDQCLKMTRGPKLLLYVIVCLLFGLSEMVDRAQTLFINSQILDLHGRILDIPTTISNLIILSLYPAPPFPLTSITAVLTGALGAGLAGLTTVAVTPLIASTGIVGVVGPAAVYSVQNSRRNNVPNRTVSRNSLGERCNNLV